MVEGANEKDSLREGVGGEEGLGGRQASVRRDWLELSLKKFEGVCRANRNWFRPKRWFPRD